jgi:hypothetical protein
MVQTPIKSTWFAFFSANFTPFILCNSLHKQDGMICHTGAEWKNHRPSAFRVSATPARETIQANCPA